jgi:dCMP deaminase
MIKEKYLGAYMKTARVFAELSTARRKRVGAVVVKDDRIISIGYNGMPSGWDNNCENEIREESEYIIDMGGPTHNMSTIRLKTKPEVLHAESNAIAKLAKSNDSGLDAELFVTHAPCMECSKLIFQSGISRVYYSSDYRDESGIRFLKQSGVEVIKHDE